MALNGPTAGRARPDRRAAAIDRAVAKAHEQARAGNRPALLRHRVDADGVARQTWAVSSRSTAGTVYLVALVADGDGIHTRCDCPAGSADRLCWHRAAARLALYGEIAAHDDRPRAGGVAAAPVAPDPADADAFAAVA
jgi:hypothetical protein